MAGAVPPVNLTVTVKLKLGFTHPPITGVAVYVAVPEVVGAPV